MSVEIPVHLARFTGIEKELDSFARARFRRPFSETALFGYPDEPHPDMIEISSILTRNGIDLEQLAQVCNARNGRGPAHFLLYPGGHIGSPDLVYGRTILDGVNALIRIAHGLQDVPNVL